MFRFHLKMNFRNDAAGALRGISNDRFKKTSSRKRQKSPCYQLGPPRRQLRTNSLAGQERNFSQAPSIPKAPSERSIESMDTINTSVGGGVMCITCSMSSGSSSSGSRILPSEPSRSSSRNTMYGLQSPWTSTTSLNHDKDLIGGKRVI